MKKNILFILFLSFLLPLTSCSFLKTDVAQEDVFVSEVLLNSFENYQECYDFYGSGSFKINFVADEKGVTDGNKAAELVSDENNDGIVGTITIGVPLYEENSPENSYRDFSKLQSVTYDVYNNGETDVTIITTPMKKIGGMSYAKPQTTTVGAKQTASVSYMVNRYEIFYALGMRGTTHINVGIKGVGLSVMLDNMRLHYVEDVFVEPEIIVDKDEIIGFEKAYQAFAVTSTGSILKTKVLGDANQSSEGTRYLCVYRDGIEDGVVSYNDGKVIIPSNYLNKMDFSKYPTTAYIAYDYKSGWVGGNFWFGPRFVSSEYGGYANILGGNLVCDGEWHTFHIPISYLPKGFDTLELLFQGGSYGNMYFDNFRVVGEVLQGTGSQFIATGYSI